MLSNAFIDVQKNNFRANTQVRPFENHYLKSYMMKGAKIEIPKISLLSTGLVISSEAINILKIKRNVSFL